MRLNRHAFRGATLIEVMLVCTIIGVLASLAIPAFSGFVVRAKTSERAVAVNGIAHVVLEKFGQENAFPNKAGANSTLAAPWNPPLPATGGQKPFDAVLAAASDWKFIAYRPDGRVRFHYKVDGSIIGGIGLLTIQAQSDLNGNNIPAIFTQDWQLNNATGLWTPLDPVVTPNGED